MSFDTTPSNTGALASACALLELNLGRRLLSLACLTTYMIWCWKRRSPSALGMSIPDLFPDPGISGFSGKNPGISRDPGINAFL